MTKIDSNGNIVPNSEIVADEKERARLQRLFSRKLGHAIDFERSPSPKRLRRGRDNAQDAVLKRLLKLREDYEAEQRKAENAGRNRTSSSSLPIKSEPIQPTTEHTEAAPEPPDGVCVLVDFATGLETPSGDCPESVS